MGGQQARARVFAAPDPARDDLTDQAVGHLRNLIDGRGFGSEEVLAGCASEYRADQWRLAFRRAARRLGVSALVLWHHCGEGPGCAGGHRYCVAAGDPDCTWHVHFTAYRKEDAARFMKAKSARLGWPKRGGGE